MRLHFVGLCTLLLLPMLGSAQVLTPGPISSADFVSANTPVTTVHTNDVPVNASTANLVKITDVGDSSYLLPRTAESAEFFLQQFLPFSIGPTPAQLSNLTLTYNLKKVNGGGTALDPETTWTIGAGVYEQIGTSMQPGTDPQILTISQPGAMQGNNFFILPPTSVNSTVKYVLSPGANYYLYLSDITLVDNTSFLPGVPTVSYANEYGGDLSNGTFTGYAASFQWQTVPEPAMIGIIAGCVVFLLRRHRSMLPTTFW